MNIEIKQVKTEYLLFVDGEHEDTFDTKEEAEDRRDYILGDENEYYCPNCNVYFESQEDVLFRKEDARFSCYHGEMVVSGGPVGFIPVCVNCDNDLEKF